MSSSVIQIYEQFAANIDKSQWLPRDKLEAHQNELLRRLSRFAFDNSPFYKQRLMPLFRHGTDADLPAWHSIQPVTRVDIVNQIDNINPKHPPDDIGPATVRQSSGTTDNRIAYRTSYTSRIAEACMMHRLYCWNKLDLSAPLASIRYYGPGQREFPTGFTESQWAFPGPPARHYSLNIGPSVSDLTKWLIDKNPTYLMTPPSLAQEIAFHPNASLLRLKGIIGVAEQTTQCARDAVRQHLKCEIFEVYGAGEVGCIALQSPTDGHFLTCDETTLVEIVDSNGIPVGPGETGRVLVTGLYNYSTPFIRYDIGDFATRAGSACPSGRGLTRLQRIDGRARNALLTANGRRIWQHEILGANEIRQISLVGLQIIQLELGKIELSYIPSAMSAGVEPQTLTSYFERTIGTPVTLEIKVIASLPRTVGGKHETVISKI